MSGGWNTIESDAGVFTYLLEGLGTKGVQFEELFALDADILQQLSPVYGVIFLFKWLSDDVNSGKDTARNPGQPQDGTYDEAAGENMFFAAQTIQNACGTQALLSVVLNQDDKFEIGDKLREFKEFTGVMPAEFRGECLSNSDLIRTTHNSFARSSPFADETQRAVNPEDAEDVYHFIAYTSINNTLYELDGLNPHPISHGPCSFADFPSKIVPVIQRRMGRHPENEIKFNLLAMIRDPREKAREIGDAETLANEQRKRSEWMWENSLRRHNFVGFVGELLKGVVREKGKDEGLYGKWVEDAKRKTEARLRERQKMGVGGAE